MILNEYFKNVIKAMEIDREMTQPPPHECCVCKSKFYSDSGGLECLDGIDEKYCPKCVRTNEHIGFIRDYTELCHEGQSPQKLAKFIIENLKPI